MIIWKGDKLNGRNENSVCLMALLVCLAFVHFIRCHLSWPQTLIYSNISRQHFQSSITAQAGFGNIKKLKRAFCLGPICDLGGVFYGGEENWRAPTVWPWYLHLNPFRANRIQSTCKLWIYGDEMIQGLKMIILANWKRLLTIGWHVNQLRNYGQFFGKSYHFLGKI